MNSRSLALVGSLAAALAAQDPPAAATAPVAATPVADVRTRIAPLLAADYYILSLEKTIIKSVTTL